MCYRGVFDMSMNVDGFDDLFATLSSLGSVGDKVGKKALRAGLKPVVKQMKIDAPKGDGSLGIPTKVNDGYKKLKVLNVKRFKNGTFIGYAGINSKNFEETKGKANQKALWKQRALKNGLYLFKHEYIFVFRK